MLERDMEELIARFPEEFFRGHGLVLKGRQQSFAGVGRFDLLFLDCHETNVLMELKARTAKYEDASQIAKYKEALEQKGERNLLMWLVAPQIPNSVREFLDRIGIEYTEIHDVQFRRIAERNGISLGERAMEAAAAPITPSARPSLAVAPQRFSDSAYEIEPNFDKTKLESLIQAFESAVRRQIDQSLAVKLRRDFLESNPPVARRETVLQLSKWCNTNNPVYWDGMEVARKISQCLFGRILDRTRFGV